MYFFLKAHLRVLEVHIILLHTSFKNLPDSTKGGKFSSPLVRYVFMYLRQGLSPCEPAIEECWLNLMSWAPHPQEIGFGMIAQASEVATIITEIIFKKFLN